MTELSFLLDLLLNHKLGKITKDALTERIKSIETKQPYASPSDHRYSAVPFGATVSQRMPIDISINSTHTPLPLDPHPPAIAVGVAQTPVAQAALAQRQQAISIAISGKEEKGRSSPRKF